MATWQFDFYFFPRNCVPMESGVVQPTLDHDKLGAANWRGSESIASSLLVDLDGILPKTTSWSSDVLQWGEADSNSIQWMSDGGKLDSIRVRVDVREIDIGFLRSIVALGAKFDLLMLTSESYVISPSMMAILAAIQKSPAFKFVSDPEAFLRRLAELQPRSGITEDEGRRPMSVGSAHSRWGIAWICFTVLWLLFVAWIAFEDTLGYGAEFDGEDLLGLFLNAVIPPLVLLALGYGVRALRQ